MKVIILTCDEYAWIVPICLYFYKKYWPDNPYETEIITESDYIKGKVFYTGGISWSSGILSYLKSTEEDKFIFIQEDFMIREKVDTAKVQEAEALCKDNIGYVRLNNAPTKYFNRHTIDSDVKGFREYPLSQRFAMTVQITVWQKDFLYDALKAGETAWETEHNGAKRLAELTHKWKALWPEERIVNYHTGGLMRKGALRPDTLKWIKPELLSDNSVEAQKFYALIEGKILSMRNKREKRC
jgi:hypothetical protein